MLIFENFGTWVAQFSRQPWQCSATAVTEFSHCNGRTVRRQWENCATEVGELCCFYSPSFLAIFLGIAFLWIRMFMVL